jgi:hypothetical protein
VQLARRRGATVIGLASEANHAWLTALGVVPVEYGNGMAERIRQASGGNVDAFIDTFGGGYVELAVELGVRPERINTIRDWQAAAKIGARTYGEGSAACAVVLGELARLAARGTGGADRPHLPAGAGARRVPRAGTAAHPRQDRAPAIVPGWPGKHRVRGCAMLVG